MRGTRGHIVSPEDVVAELTEGVADPTSMVCSSARWADVQLAEMSFPESGGVVIPPISFYSVSSHTGTRSYLSEDDRIVGEGGAASSRVDLDS